MIDRWIADSADGFLQATAEEPVPGKTQTVYEIDGSERVEPYVIRLSLAVFRKGDLGAALFRRGDRDPHREWITAGPGLAVAGWDTGWLDYPGPIPPESILPADQLAEVLRQFVTTKRQPTCVRWREQPVPVYGDGGAVVGWTLAGRTYPDKPEPAG